MVRLTRKMKNLFLHHISIITPIGVLALTWKEMPLEAALVFFTLYFVYRSWIDGRRLYKKGLVEKKDIWKVGYNGMRTTYFKDLYLKR